MYTLKKWNYVSIGAFYTPFLGILIRANCFISKEKVKLFFSNCEFLPFNKVTYSVKRINFTKFHKKIMKKFLKKQKFKIKLLQILHQITNDPDYYEIKGLSRRRFCMDKYRKIILKNGYYFEQGLTSH